MLYSISIPYRKQNLEDVDREELYVPNSEQRDVFRGHFLFHQVKLNIMLKYIKPIMIYYDNF